MNAAVGPIPAAGAAFDWALDAAPDGTPLAGRVADAAGWLPTLRSSGDEEQDETLFTRLVALCDRRGAPAFSSGWKPDRIGRALRGLADAWGLDEPSHALRCLAALAPGRLKDVSFPEWDADSGPGFLSDPAALGLLRTDWGRTADAIALAWPDGGSVLELRANGRRLISGEWGLEVAIDGEPLDLAAGWDCVCRHADEDGGFLELQWCGESGAGAVTVERQAFLSRDGSFALLSDAVRLEEKSVEALIEYDAKLPLSAGVSGGVAPGGAEARLFSGKKNWQRARLFPLGAAASDGGLDTASMTVDVEAVLLQARSRGGLVAPLAFDWNRWREDDPADWRALTVTENRRRLEAAQAGAHRLRIGEEHQLLTYRRTDRSVAPRAVLGHHHDHETLIATLNRKGEVTPLLKV
ncbi:MAG: hypothetical protein AAF907_05680 [Planctomycetota bacterium]